MASTKRALILSFLTVSASAHCADLGWANSFNAFIFGNATTYGGHSQGSIAVGGNWTMSYEAQQNSSPRANLPTAPNAGIYVGGNVTVTGVARVLRGNAYVGGSIYKNNVVDDGAIDVQNGYQLYKGSTYVKQSDFTNQYAYSTQQAAYMNSLNGITINPFMNNLNINLANNNLNGNTKVYNLDASLFNNSATVDFSGLTADTSIIMNVHGGSNINWNWSVNGNIQSKIIWNFLDASSLTLGRQLDGSILAPNTHVKQVSGSINGTLIAGEWTNYNSQELHSFLYSGSGGGSFTPVPEPATMAIMGLGAAAYIRKRRKKNA